MGRKKTGTLRKAFDQKHETTRANEADFAEKMKSATSEAKALYRRCQSAIRGNKKKQEAFIYISAATSEAARDAAALLIHPRNGYSTWAKTDSPPDGSLEQFTVVIVGNHDSES